MKVVKIRRPKQKITNNTTRLVDAKKELRRKYKTDLAGLMRESPAPTEKMMIDLLTENEIPFSFQVEILGYIVDFYFKGAKSILEVDGAIHKKQEDYDRTRDKAFKDNGFRTLRVSGRSLMSDPLGVLMLVRAYLQNGKRVAKVAKKKRAKAAKVTRWQDVPKLTPGHLAR